MITLNKLKYALNIHLTTLDVTYNPIKQTKNKQLFQRKNIKFEMHVGISGNVGLRFFPCKFYKNLR